MKLEEFLCEKKWSALIFSRVSGIRPITLYKLLNNMGSVSLDTALVIEMATDGKVTPWDLSVNSEAIRAKTFKSTSNEFSLSKRPTLRKKNKKTQPKQTNEEDMKSEISICEKPIE